MIARVKAAKKAKNHSKDHLHNIREKNVDELGLLCYIVSNISMVLLVTFVFKRRWS